MSSDGVKTYSADEVTLSLAGIPINSGYADGEFVSVEPQSDDFGDAVGADGEVVRWKTNDGRATVKIKLMQTSLGNNVLSQLRTLAKQGTNGADVGSFLLEDRSGGLLVRDDHAWVMKPPTPSRGREATETEWTIRLAHAEMDINGNESI